MERPAHSQGCCVSHAGVGRAGGVTCLLRRRPFRQYCIYLWCLTNAQNKRLFSQWGMLSSITHTQCPARQCLREERTSAWQRAIHVQKRRQLTFVPTQQQLLAVSQSKIKYEIFMTLKGQSSNSILPVNANEVNTRSLFYTPKTCWRSFCGSSVFP